MDVSDQVIFRAAPDCVVCPFGDGVAVLDMRSNTYFTLNQVAAVVWTGLEAGGTLDDLVTRVTDEFDVAPDICAPDVDALLTDMKRAGLVNVQ